MPRPLYFLSDEIHFPPVEQARIDGLLAVGGDFRPERLLLAYRSGIFPWPMGDDDVPLLWFAPGRRAVIEPEQLHVSRSLRKTVRQRRFEIRFDTAFRAVMTACAEVPRPSQGGTWILSEMIDAYTALHEAGWAHSVESWQDGELVGGLYGLSMGACFFGESMFSTVSDASKVALVGLSRLLATWRFHFIDCQVMNNHLEQFGVYLIPRAEYMRRLKLGLAEPDRRHPWTAAGADLGEMIP